MHEVTVTHAIRLPDGYELAPGPQPRIPTEEDGRNGYRLLSHSVDDNGGPLTSNILVGTAFILFRGAYFILTPKPIGVKMVFVDVRKFRDVPKGGVYHWLADGIASVRYTTTKGSENSAYGHQTCERLVVYYATELIYPK